MRLAEQTQKTIANTAHEIFGASVAVKVFGSRLDDQVTGGDIDLLIESPQIIAQARYKSLQLVARLQMRLGDQAIDVLVVDPHTEYQAIHHEAVRTGEVI